MNVIGKMGKRNTQKAKKNMKENVDDSASNKEFKILIRRIVQKTKIAEGELAIYDILRCIYRNQPISTKKIGQYTKLPLPIVSKVRTMLEGDKVLKRDDRGAIYTKEGLTFVEKNLGLSLKNDLKCPLCKGKTIVFDEKFEKIYKRHKEIAKQRPAVNTLIDQSFATPETATYRATIMADRGDLEGKRVLFVGDDDLTSIPVAMSGLCKEVVVADIDERLLDMIKYFSKQNKLHIKTVKQDFRNSLPKNLTDKFDVVFTDPPYTLEGVKLFMNRGIEALGSEGVLYLAVSHKPIDEHIQLQKNILSMNFLIAEMLPGFNFYEGTEIIGNTTFLARLVGKNLVKLEEKSDKIYTGQVKPVLRYYKCQKCGKIYEVGGKIKRIEDLSCDCKGNKFYMIKRSKLRD
ncbi:bis-aminopropyl spermidine synthase family protein [Methanococcus voltae]|uniref:N(4)-bis(aminopropyl)spermidine synthase C-terminal domain-containing protein n=1 Tax=Methanococcus voltae (strain ATCC BAA-1334 / A3) TaxID=456320 RepID=D7DV03_METV3|nr:putative methyltransferase [Methanococcus voltae]